METEYKSRTQKKKEDQALQRLGEQLVALQPSLLESMALPDELLENIKFARKIKSHGARRRQIRHIGAVLRHMDPQPIETALAHIRSGNLPK
jgi:ribosome-associated protein